VAQRQLARSVPGLIVADGLKRTTPPERSMIARRRWFSHRAPEIPRSEDMSRRSAKGSITRTGEMVDSGDWVAEGSR
jgi:hypothetical protein